jgi:hypothetical protein
MTPVIILIRINHHCFRVRCHTRMVQGGNAQVAQVLFRWSEVPDDMASWEDSTALRQPSPLTPAWGQAGLQGRRNVSTAKDAEVEMPAQANGPRRSSRPWKQNKQVTGPEWV